MDVKERWPCLLATTTELCAVLTSRWSSSRWNDCCATITVVLFRVHSQDSRVVDKNTQSIDLKVYINFGDRNFADRRVFDIYSATEFRPSNATENRYERVEYLNSVHWKGSVSSGATWRTHNSSAAAWCDCFCYSFIYCTQSDCINGEDACPYLTVFYFSYNGLLIFSGSELSDFLNEKTRSL